MKIKPEQYEIFRHWLKGIIKPRLLKDMQGEVEDILEKTNQWEVESMVYNLERVIDDVSKKGIEEGIEKGKIEVAKNLLTMGMDILTVIKVIGLEKEEIERIKANMN